MPISLAVIDSYNLIRHAFSQQLQMVGFNVIIEAENGDDFMRKVEVDPAPEVCIVDIDTPFIHQFDTAKRIKQKFPMIKILAYTLYERRYKKVKHYGIDVFLDKDCSIAQITDKILNLTES